MDMTLTRLNQDLDLSTNVYKNLKNTLHTDATKNQEKKRKKREKKKQSKQKASKILVFKISARSAFHGRFPNNY